MSIGKKLYAGFGLVLAILVGLFLVNTFAALRGRASRADSAASLKGVQTIGAIRLQIMHNRLNLDNFLLSGDPRDEEKVRSEEHTSELQSRQYLVCRLLLEKKKKNNKLVNY